MVIRCVESACGLRERGRVCPAGEDGSITILSLFFFIMMLTICGIAVDYMRLEALRVKLQSTADRAALAATKLDQSLDPESVVRDYFARDGLVEYVKAVRVHRDTGTDRALSVDAELEAKTFFMHLAGVEDVTVRARATAVEQRSSLEISLVLDVSASMHQNSRIDNLRVAAQDFVDTIYSQNDDDFLATISLVPYNDTVSIGPILADYYTLIRPHPHSTCPTLQETPHSMAWINPDMPLSIVPYMQRYPRHISSPVTAPTDCNPSPFLGHGIRPFMTDAERAKGFIRSLFPDGNTAIDLGMKWGVTLLDPQTRQVTAELINDGHVPARIAMRPSDYSGANQNLKVVVLMTDGKNTIRYDLEEPYKSGMSDVWVYRETPGQPLHDIPLDHFSLETGENRFYRLNVGQSERILPAPYEEAGGSVTQVSWPELYATWTTGGIGEVLFQQAAADGEVSQAYVNAPHDAITDLGPSKANNRLSAICSTAKDMGIVIFSIAFEAPGEGKRVLSECASSDAHYFDVYGTEISDAFAAIARTIQVLRLTE